MKALHPRRLGRARATSTVNRGFRLSGDDSVVSGRSFSVVAGLANTSKTTSALRLALKAAEQAAYPGVRQCITFVQHCVVPSEYLYQALYAAIWPQSKRRHPSNKQRALDYLASKGIELRLVALGSGDLFTEERIRQVEEGVLNHLVVDDFEYVTQNFDIEKIVEESTAPNMAAGWSNHRHLNNVLEKIWSLRRQYRGLFLVVCPLRRPIRMTPEDKPAVLNIGGVPSQVRYSSDLELWVTKHDHDNSTWVTAVRNKKGRANERFQLS